MNQPVQQTDTDLSFENEEARLVALDALEEVPENEDQLKAITEAPIAPKVEGEPAPTPEPGEPAPAPAPAPEATPAPAPAPAPQPTGDTPPAPAGEDAAFTVKASELPKGPNGETYKNIGEFFKAWGNQSELVLRQQTHIRENPGSSVDLNAALERAKTAEAGWEAAKKAAPGAPPAAQVAPGAEAQIGASESKIADITAKLEALKKSDDPLSNESIAEQNELLFMMTGELGRLSNAYNGAQGELTAIRGEFGIFRDETGQFVQKFQQTSKAEKAEQAASQELTALDTFGGIYPEFKMSKTAKESEGEYIEWATAVTKMHYGRPIDIRTTEGRAAMAEAVKQIQLKAPELIDKCSLAGVAVDPSIDVQKYLEMCELLDYRDGWRKDPTTGNLVQTKRADGTVDRFPDGSDGLRAAYEYRKVSDGVWAQQVNDAYASGGSGALAASTRRDAGAVEVSGDEPAGGEGALSGDITFEQAINAMNQIDEEQALMRAQGGDTKLLDELNRYLKMTGNQPHEFPGYTYSG